MTIAAKLGQLFRREGSLTSIRNVRALDAQRAERHGLSTQEALAKRLSYVERRITALEADVLGQEKIV